ncbi:hypothetical protein N0V93_008740 [Gnomoniopsis smithogilvyi]|uniref:Uncharacterized protein n=1 Tax=Gnomoniopsis smithogilvyi TaxID=1191159 RepID=A0A9W8YQL4_9PEZI|nr:hypothetical protein N0V93_008740 [Gnomoniopsis smithogilvyi]
MAEVIGGLVFKELVGAFFMVAYTICVSTGLVGAATGLNALSNHAVSGFISVYVAVFIVVVGVTTLDRPAAAPQTGEFDLGYHVIAQPTFVAAITAVSTIFVSSSGSSAFLPVISEMRRPKDYNKAVYLCMSIVTASYLSFSLVVYRWCGQWVASPSLGSAGPVIKKVAYGIGLIGLLVSACIYLHVAAK